MTKAEAIDTLVANYPDSCYELLKEAVDMAIEALQEPERKKGKWIKAYPTHTEVWMCSKCHYIDEPKWSYCHNCGALMDGRQEGELE